MKKLFYEITDKGYHIQDENDALFHIHQYEPYIPKKNLNYEENALAQIHEIMVGEYAREVFNERMAMEEVPADYIEEVQEAVSNMEDWEKAYKIVTGEVE